MSQAIKQQAVPMPMPMEPYQAFPVELLPGVVKRYVVEASNSIGCDTAYVALPMLSALSAAIGATRVIELKADWHESPILWTAVIGESGTHKTPAQKVALQAIRSIESRQYTQFVEAQQLHDQELVQHEEARRQWRKVQHGAPPAEPQPPTLGRLSCGDTTVEAVAGLLADNPRGLLLVRDELSGWFGSFNAYKPGSGDESNWLELHQGNAITIDRKTGARPMIHVPRTSLSLTGGVQPGILRDLLSKAKFESGMVARFLMAYPPKRTKKWRDQELHAESKAALQSLFERLYELTGVEDGGPITAMLSGKAKLAWIEYYEEHAQEQSDLSGPLASAWSKLEAYAARLALIVHEARVAEHHPPLVDRYTVDEQSIKAGVGLARWFGRETKRIYAYLRGSETAIHWHAVAEFINLKGGRVSMRDLQRGPCRGEEVAVIRSELRPYIESGWLISHRQPPSEQGGRPGEAYTLGEAVTGDKTPNIDL